MSRLWICMYLYLVVLVDGSNTKSTGKSHETKHWVLLVAGSSTWTNYRHQADICHAYQILHRHGIPDEQIVVMIYDDIANNSRNPTPGVIINQPDGENVYKGVPKDYTGEAVTPDNFLKVLQGEANGLKAVGSGKVIRSGPNDHVFVYFSDHGAPGLVTFPYTKTKERSVLHAQTLQEAIRSMHHRRKYKQMVIYLETCESGSMFEKLLPDNINVFAMTAANATQPSFAFYMDKLRKVFLGDLFSIRWMENSEKADMARETLRDQFKLVREQTNKSRVMQYGDLSIAKEPLLQFQGNPKVAPPRVLHREVKKEHPDDAVKAEDVPLAILNLELRQANTQEQQQEVINEINNLMQHRVHVEKTMSNLVALLTRDSYHASKIMTLHRLISNCDCYEQAVDAFHNKCFNLSKYDYALRQLYALVNLCEEQISPTDIVAAMDTVC